MAKAGRPKGHIKSGGRQKGSLNKDTILFKGILEDKKTNLVDKAIKLALEGNAAIMCKLLDKVLPSLNHNENLELKSVADYIREKREKENGLKIVISEKAEEKAVNE